MYDDDLWFKFLPLTYNKPLCEIVIGKSSIAKRWEQGLNLTASHITQDHLTEMYPVHIKKDNILVNGSIIPSAQIIRLVQKLHPNEAIMDYNNELIAARLPEDQFNRLEESKPIDELIGMPVQPDLYLKLNQLTDLLDLQNNVIKVDVKELDETAYHHNIDQSIGAPGLVFVHNTAELEPCYLDTRNGPIIFMEYSKVLSGSTIKGPCIIGPHSVVKSNSVIYGPFSCGSKCTIGGEVKNSIFQSYSSKGHFGYLGDSMLGAHCNLGAGTSVSNLKNTLQSVHIWDYQEDKFMDAERNKLGAIIADFSKTAIHTTLNTGTVIGVSCNIYGSGFPRKFIPSFSWGGPSGYINFELEKALEVASLTKETKDEKLSEKEKNILAAIYKISEKYRIAYK